MLTFIENIGIGNIKFQYPSFWKIYKNLHGTEDHYIFELRNHLIGQSPTGQIKIYIKLKTGEPIKEIINNYITQIKDKFQMSGGFLLRKNISPCSRIWSFRPNLSFDNLPLYFNSNFIETDIIFIIISILGPLPNQSRTIYSINEKVFTDICNTIHLEKVS